MTDFTIPDLNAAANLDGTEEIEIYQGSPPSVRSTTGDIAKLAAANNNVVVITTGASPIDVPFLPGVTYAITSGGTGGTETVNILWPSAPIGGFANPALMGARCNIGLYVQTDPGDVISITAHGNPQIPVIQSEQFFAGLPNQYHSTNNAGFILNRVGHAASFLWANDYLGLDKPMNDFDDNTAWISIDTTLTTATPASGNSSGALIIRTADADVQAGNINIAPGTGGTTPGNVTITLQSGGQLITANLPTADPGQSGALWVDPATHILHVSP